MYKMAGSHPGSRPVHAKGLVCQGTFRASAEAPRMSRAEHLRGQPIPATIRFANASGDPDVHDGQPNVRSMAVKLQVAGGKPADILANSIEGFVARTPDVFSWRFSRRNCRTRPRASRSRMRSPDSWKAIRARRPSSDD